MRFHVGFSKRIDFKWILLILGGLLAFFGINNITVLALEDGFTNRSIANIKYCTGAGVSDPNTSCDVSSSTYQNTNTNGVIDSMAPIGVENSDARRTPSAKSLFWIYSGVSASGSDNPCNNPNTLSFNVTLSLNDINSVLADNELNPNSYTGPPSPVITSIREAVLRFTRKSYSNSSTYYQYTGTNNSVGVFTGFRTGTGEGQIRNQTNCSFLSYGSKKSLNFRCTVNATYPANSLYIGINYKNTSYVNNSSLYSNLRIYDAIKVSEINDPCNNNYASDSQGVIDSINGQSGQIAQNTQDLIDSQNNINDNITDFKNNNHQDLEDLKDKADAINDKLDGIQDSFDELNCLNIYGNDLPFLGVLDTNGTVGGSTNYHTSDFLKVGYTSSVVSKSNNVNYRVGFYRTNKELISVITISDTNFNINSYISSHFNNDKVGYFRVSLYNVNMSLKYCTNLGQTLTDSDIYGLGGSYNFGDSDPHGFGDIITAPIRLYQSLHDAAYRWNGGGGTGVQTRGGTGDINRDANLSPFTCDDLSIPFNFMGNSNNHVKLPCGKIIWNNASENFHVIWNVAVWGLFIWGSLIRLIDLAHDIADPNNTEEVNTTVKNL